MLYLHDNTMRKYGQKILPFMPILIDCESNSNFHVFFALDLHMKTKRFCKLPTRENIICN